MIDGEAATPEERLKALLAAGQEANRFQWLKEWKAQGKKVVGVLDSYVPEEVIYAAGMLPWQIIGTWRQNTPLALVYRPANTCRYCTHVLESMLSGELDDLDGIVSTDWDDDRRRLFDQWEHLAKSSFRHVLHVPVEDSALTRRYFAEKVAHLANRLAEFGGVAITEEALGRAIELYNKMRSLLRRVYELRKRTVPPLTGAEMLGLTTAAFVMPKDVYVRELEDLLPYLETRRPPNDTLRPRILVSSDRLDNPAYLALVEDVGALVAMDDLDTGSRYFWQLVEPGGDPIRALSDRYLTRAPCPRMLFWERQVRQLTAWVGEWQIDGVINFPQRFSYPRLFATPHFEDQMAKAAIPFTTIEREYYFGNIGQLRTRIGAFVENL